MTRKHRKNNKHRISKVCTECNGSGTKREVIECPDCYGTGNFVKKHEKPCKCGGMNNNCRRCHGSGTRVFYNGVVPCRRCVSTGKVLSLTECGTCGHKDKQGNMTGTMEELWPAGV